MQRRIIPTLALAAAACLWTAPAAAQTCTPRSSWPTQEWPSRVDAVKAAKAAAIKALEDYAFTLQGKEEDRVGIRTDGVVIIHQGAVIYERYARGYTPDMRHLAWSVSKSFTNALAGLAVGRGNLKITDSICAHLKRFEGTHACRITVQNLLEMASGLDWNEVYENASKQHSSVLAMLYGVGQKDAAAFIAGHPFAADPGTAWSYSTGDTALLMAVVQAAVMPELGEDFAWKLLFDPVGIKSATWETDGKGTLAGGSSLFVTPRDMARFGYLYLNDGCWENARLLPASWVSDSIRVNEPNGKTRDERYGWQWWLNGPTPEAEFPLPHPELPENVYFALGHWGQSISILPSQELVIVRTGDDRDGAFDLQTFVKLAMEVAAP